MKAQISSNKDRPPLPSFIRATKCKRKRLDHVRDTAARLFAELFYHQVIEERWAKLKKQKGEGKND